MSRRTPLYEEHVKLKAKIVDFAGWEMPIQYTGVIDEHRSVRTNAGLFDVSHMGEIEISGADAESFIQYLTTNDVKKMYDGRAMYSTLCNERGTIVDDIIVYRFSATRYILVVNASNAQKDLAWIKKNSRGDVKITDLSDSYALMAFQGPKAASILSRVTSTDLTKIGTYHFAEGTVAGKKAIIARTGYTGEDGFEIFTSPADAAHVWSTLLSEGKADGAAPIGLGARDTLRLEMKYSLYGHEIDDTTNPVEAGLSWVVKFSSPDDFIGKKVIVDVKEKGPARKLIGFKMIERGIPRQGYQLICDDGSKGIVTSGTMSPSLNVAIGIGYVPVKFGAIGTKFSVDIRGEERKAEVVKTPFYIKK